MAGGRADARKVEQGAINLEGKLEAK